MDHYQSIFSLNSSIVYTGQSEEEISRPHFPLGFYVFQMVWKIMSENENSPQWLRLRRLEA